MTIFWNSNFASIFFFIVFLKNLKVISSKTCKDEKKISNIDCFQWDKASILREKVKINDAKGDFVYNFRWIDPDLTFEDNGIYKDECKTVQPNALCLNYIIKYYNY